MKGHEANWPIFLGTLFYLLLLQSDLLIADVNDYPRDQRQEGIVDIMTKKGADDDPQENTQAAISSLDWKINWRKSIS